MSGYEMTELTARLARIRAENMVSVGADDIRRQPAAACPSPPAAEKKGNQHQEPNKYAAQTSTTTIPTTHHAPQAESPAACPSLRAPSADQTHFVLPQPLRKVLTLLLSQWLMFGLGLVCVLAYLFPQVAAHGGIIRSEYSILYGAVAIIFAISGLSLSPHTLLVHALNWRLHLLVQGFCFVLCPVSVYALVRIIDAGDGDAGTIDRAVLVGWLLTACIPTTIASNVVMTRAAGGDEAAALVEVLLGNVFGPVVSPAWTVALIPHNERFAAWSGDTGDLTGMYRSVFRLLGLSVYLPLIVGQCVRWAWPERTAWCVGRLYLGKVGTVCLLLLIWSSFSSCFATSALQSLATPTILLVVFLNIAIYLLWTILCLCFSRLTPSVPLRTQKIIRGFNKRETVAICFCGPAKTAALGIPLLYAMWVSLDPQTKAKMSIPVILYTTEQVFCAHFLVALFKRWITRDDVKRSISEEEGEDQPQQ